MTTDYDPYSDQAMRDPLPLYAALRAEGKPHYIEKYNAWALARFKDVMEASIQHEKNVTFTAGQTPGQLLLGEPILKAFTTMDAPEHRKWRAVVRKSYTPEGVEEHRQRFTELVRTVLQPLLVRGEFDIYRDYANQVFCLNSGYNLGLSLDESVACRALIDDMLHREPGQIGGGSERNQKAGAGLMEFLAGFVQRLRAHPKLAVRHTAAYLNADIDGKTLNDEELALLLTNFLIVGSETTPMVVAGMLYHLAQNPTVKATVLKDHSLIKNLYTETCRYDQPTNMLCRRAVNAFELNGAKIQPGQTLLYIYASANRDEAEFERADTFDIFRKTQRDLTYGAGGHKCLGMHMATMGAEILVTELFKCISDYEILEDQCERAYGEFLNGHLKVPIRLQQ